MGIPLCCAAALWAGIGPAAGDQAYPVKALRMLSAGLGGRVQMMFPNAAAALPHVKAGRLRGLAVTSAQPSPMAPGLPTVAAAGLPGYECVALYAVLAPAGTPAGIVRRVSGEIVALLNQPDVADRFRHASV